MRSWVLGAVLAVALSGCDRSPVSSDATVVITGRALSATGAPLASTTVHLYKEADFGEAVIGSVLAVGTLGGVCLFPGAPAVCHRGHSVRTAADGSFRFTLKGSDTQGMIGDKATLDLVIADPRAGVTGPSTTIRFTVGANTVGLPTARLWNAAPRVTEAHDQIAVRWSNLPAAFGTGAVYGALLQGSTGGVPIWTQPSGAGHAELDARILEDRAGRAGVTARTTLAHGVHAVYQSASLPARAIAGVPPSRHRPCFAVTGTSTIATTKQATCAATDGDFTTAARLTAAKGQVVTGVVVDLGQARPISFVVVRGTGGQIVVEVSSDGASYRQVGTGSGTTIAVSPPGHPAARYVRVRSPGGLGESLLTEVSAW